MLPLRERMELMSIIKDINLKEEGHRRIAWVAKNMPVLNAVGDRFEREKPFAGMKIALSIHLEAKTAYLVKTLARGGAEMHVSGSNPLSTQDCICAALADDGMTVNAIHGSDPEQTVALWKETLSCHPDLVIDDGSDLINLLLGESRAYADRILGGCEETTSGVQRLRGWERTGRLAFPVMAINDAHCKSFFDNTYGTGQSSWDGIMRTTNLQINGKTVVVAGYGFCSSGIAMRAKGLGANVIVTEVNPFRALEAAMDGFRVMKMDDAAPLGDIFVTATGCRDVIIGRHFERMKNNVLLANAGHFDVEINKNDLASMAVSIDERKPFITGYTMKDGRRLNLLADGRLVNIVAGNGHPAEIMDLSFAIQALSARYLALHGKELAPGLYNVPKQIDDEVINMKLRAMNLGLDELTPEQKAYLSGK